MAYTEPPPAKYLRVLNAIRVGIEDGTYLPGKALPSENQLATEFGISRPTVVKALKILAQDGWLESEQGKGHFVRGRPAMAARRPPEHAQEQLALDEVGETELLRVGAVLASPRVAAAMGLVEGTPVIMRQRRTLSEIGPVDLAAVYFPVDITAGTELSKPEPIAGGLRRHLEQRQNVRLDYATERIGARPASADEAKLLDISEGDAVLSLLTVVYDMAGRALMALDITMPGTRREIEDLFPLS